MKPKILTKPKQESESQPSQTYQKPQFYFLGSLEQVQGDRFGDFYDASGRRY